MGAIVHDRRDRLLLIRRAHDPGRGLWSLPGGRVEPGETEHEAVVREIAEETGLAVRVLRLVGRVRRPAPGGRVYDIADYLCEVADPRDGAGTGDAAGAAPDPVAGDDADDARWVDAAGYARLPVIGGMWEVLREWGALPPGWVD